MINIKSRAGHFAYWIANLYLQLVLTCLTLLHVFFCFIFAAASGEIKDDDNVDDNDANSRLYTLYVNAFLSDAYITNYINYLGRVLCCLCNLMINLLQLLYKYFLILYVGYLWVLCVYCSRLLCTECYTCMLYSLHLVQS